MGDHDRQHDIDLNAGVSLANQGQGYTDSLLPAIRGTSDWLRGLELLDRAEAENADLDVGGEG